MSSAAEQIRAWADAAQREASAAQALADGMAALRATARDPSGDVIVTIDAGGALVGLELTGGTRGLSPDRLAATIMSTVRAARGTMLERITEVVEETVGTGSPTGAGVLELQQRRLGAALHARASAEPA